MSLRIKTIKPGSHPVYEFINFEILDEGQEVNLKDYIVVCIDKGENIETATSFLNLYRFPPLNVSSKDDIFLQSSKGEFTANPNTRGGNRYVFYANKTEILYSAGVKVFLMKFQKVNGFQMQ